LVSPTIGQFGLTGPHQSGLIPKKMIPAPKGEAFFGIFRIHSSSSISEKKSGLLAACDFMACPYNANGWMAQCHQNE
jgi:hypothetical protein